MDAFKRDWMRWFPEDQPKEAKPPRAHRPVLGRVLLALALLLLLFILANIAKGYYTDWLWFGSLGYAGVFTTILKTKLLVFLLAAVLFAGLLLGSLVLATRLAPQRPARFWPWALVSHLQRVARWNVILGTVVLGLIFGAVAQGNWETILRFFNWQPFGVLDPVFQKDAGFYVFSLPFQQFVRGWLLGAFIMVFIITAVTYLLTYAAQRLRFNFSRPVMAHLGGILIAILAIFAWGYRLGIWELVYSQHGVVFGASYADIHARIPAQWLLLGVVIVLIGVVGYAAYQARPRLVLYGIGGWIAAAIVFGAIFPALVQRFQVQPNELARETPYINYNIQFTRDAFALDRIDEQAFPAEPSPSAADIAQNDATINNVRLWDHRPLLDTYNQIQSIRLYYDFNDVDVDRYIIDGDYRQVMLSARELSADKLAGQAQTWVNRKLQFTHGYGAVLSPVNEITAEGLPDLLLKDIPPAGSFNITRPQIYYGEKTNDYVIVDTRTQEFDYPRGDDNVYGRYQGGGGISLGGFFRRFVYAWQFGDINILLSSELTPDSQLLYHRNIQDRVSHLAPFLQLDADPYLVIVDGKLYWIQDAYTTTGGYPYSQPVAGGTNYIRNSVKAVIDAYDGSIKLYVTEPDDALIKTYEKIFPGLFIPASQMPEAFRLHLRYPEDMFNMQATVYRSYHMRDPRVFYNKEDLWAVPREVYAGQEQLMDPYYVIMRLPGESQEEFLLMLPFTPVNKNNTIGWLAARCDGDNYGKLLAYLFPKERLVYGPSQIENRIQQDTTITEQLALWSRGGSQVLRGNLLFIPIEKSNIYVEPVFLQANTGGLPELKRVIVAVGDKIAMEPGLAESLQAIYGQAPATGPPTTPSTPGQTISPEVASLVAEAQQHYQKAQEDLKAGDWAGYGSELAALQDTLNKLAALTAGSSP